MRTPRIALATLASLILAFAATSAAFAQKGSFDDGTALRVAAGGRFEIGQSRHAFTRAEISALNEDSFGDDTTHIAIGFLLGWNLGSRAPGELPSGESRRRDG